MKAFKKNIFLFILILIGIFFTGKNIVFAGSINWEGVKTECIYTDGGAYSTTYAQKTDGSGGYNTITNRVTYNLLGVDTTKSGTTSSVVYINHPVNYSSTPPKCIDSFIVGVVKEQDPDDTSITRPTSHYKFGGSSFVDGDFTGANWWQAFWTSQKSASEKKTEAENTKQKYTLVAERYILSERAGEPDYTLTYREESEQATGSDNYAYIMVYGSTYLLKTKEKTTILEDGTGQFSGISVNENGEVVGIDDKHTICINNPEPFSTTDSAGVASYYYRSGQVRYKIGSCGSTYDRKYVLFNTGLGSGDAPSDELCESIMPETSKILKKIIKIVQILTPVLMIVLCGIDIGKIVVSGNIEEDLPKQKRKIVIRMIVGVTVFFLPFVTFLVISYLKDSGAVDAQKIQAIECLFE